MHSFSFDKLKDADLHVDAIYVGGRRGNAGDNPLPRLLSVSNQAGFRYRGTLDRLDLLVLTSSLNDPDWPDELDPETGIFTYFGDNKRPGRPLHSTPRFGNEILRRVFEESHGPLRQRARIPPIFVFANTGVWRDVVFLGLAVPGTTASVAGDEDLVAIWRYAEGKRFQNYRARFTILDAPTIERAWINDVIDGHRLSDNAPAAWRAWVDGANPKALRAARSVEYRTKNEQLPKTPLDKRILAAVQGFFSDQPHDFEACAAELARMLIRDITAVDLTRRSRDGGRDAIGQMRIGHGTTSIDVTFSLEAKCYSSNNAVGVREMSRLISRLRHREFGILVTTSYVDLQTFREITEDEHPIVVLSGGDIVELLRRHGYGTLDSVVQWLDVQFRRNEKRPSPEE